MAVLDNRETSASTTDLDLPRTDPTYTRRKFLQWGIYAIGGATAVAIGVPTALYFINPALKTSGEGNQAIIELGSLQDLANQTKPLTVAKPYKYLDGFKEEERNKQVFVRALVANASKDTDFQILDSTCTHAGCPVAYDPPNAPPAAKGKFYCPCHGSIYDINGKNLVVAPAPLAQYKPIIRDGKLVFDVFQQISAK